MISRIYYFLCQIFSRPLGIIDYRWSLQMKSLILPRQLHYNLHTIMLERQSCCLTVLLAVKTCAWRHTMQPWFRLPTLKHVQKKSFTFWKHLSLRYSFVEKVETFDILKIPSCKVFIEIILKWKPAILLSSNWRSNARIHQWLRSQVMPKTSIDHSKSIHL